MGEPLSSRAAEAYRAYKKGKKAYDYYKLVKATVDEDTRTGALFKLGIKFSVDVIGKVIGTSLTSHPYFTYHKVHIEVLVQALNATSMKDHAVEALSKAVASADSASDLAHTLGGYKDRKNALGWVWMLNLAEPIRMMSQYKTNPGSVAKDIADSGRTPEQMNAYLADYLDNLRARWAELCMDTLALLAMVDTEYRMADEAMNRYNAKMKKMQEGGNLGKIAAYSTDQERQWQQYERMVNPSASKPSQSVEDPAGFARKQRDSVDTVASSFSTACDLVMSDEVLRPGAYDQAMQKL
jgi:hypothetical protein